MQYGPAKSARRLALGGALLALIASRQPTRDPAARVERQNLNKIQ